MTSEDLQWLASIESFIGPHHLTCLKLVVGQQIGRYSALESAINVLGVHDLLKADKEWPPEKSLQLIVDFLTLCRLQQCVNRLGEYGLDDLPSLDLKALNDGARYARLVAGVYCALSDKERKAFKAKYCKLSNKGDKESEEKFLAFVVHKVSHDLLQEAVEGIQVTTKSGNIVEQVFLEENIKPNLQRAWSNLGILIWIVVLVLLLLLFSLFVILLALPIRLPTNYTATHTAQSGVVVVAARVDPFWYGEVELDVPAESGYKATVTVPLSCTDLVSRVHSLNKTSASNLTRERSNQPLQSLEDHSYLVENSTLNITITIVDQPALAPVLYQLNNWTQYLKMLSIDDPPPTGQYVASYPINKTGNTTISITVTSDDFHFFLLFLPATTTFQFRFWLNRYYYSYDDYKFACTSSTSCRFPLTPSYTSGSDIQCQLLQLLGGDNDFISVNTNISRNPIVLSIFVPAIIMTLILILFLLAYVVGVIFCIMRICKDRMKVTGIV